MFYGERLKYLREEAKLKQEDIAKILDINLKTYSLYETETFVIPCKHLILLAEYYDVALDYLFNFINIKQYNNAKKEFDVSLFRTRFKNFRKENKLTQNRISNLLNTTNTVISDYEVGRRLIATPFLYTICKKYNISADYLLGKIDEPIYFN